MLIPRPPLHFSPYNSNTTTTSISITPSYSVSPPPLSNIPTHFSTSKSPPPLQYLPTPLSTTQTRDIPLISPHLSTYVSTIPIIAASLTSPLLSLHLPDTKSPPLLSAVFLSSAYNVALTSGHWSRVAEVFWCRTSGGSGRKCSEGLRSMVPGAGLSHAGQVQVWWGKCGPKFIDGEDLVQS